MKKILILIISLFLITGCSYKELNDLAIVTAIGIDYVDDKYLVSAQIMNLQKSEGDKTTQQAILYKGTGVTIVQALRNIMKQYSKTIYLGHLELAVLGKDIIEKKTNDIFDYFISSPESSNDFMVLVNNEGLAEDIIDPKKAASESESNPTKDILQSLKNTQDRQGIAYEINFEEFVALYLEIGKDPVIPIIKYLENEESSSNVMITSMVAFKNNVLQKELTDEQAIAFSTLNNYYYDVPFNATYKDKIISVLMINPTSKYGLEIKDGKVKVNIKINLEGHASEVDTKVILSEPKTAKEIESIYEKQIKKNVESLIDYCKENDVDILGLKNMIYKNYYKDYKKYEDKNIYEIADINIEVKIKMYRYGNAYVGISKD